MTTVREDDWGFLDSDDQFHTPETEDPWWTETVWFSWMIPERSLLGSSILVPTEHGHPVRWRARRR